MTTMTRRLGIVILLVPVLAGCGAAKFDRLQAEYSRLALALDRAERAESAPSRRADPAPSIRMQLAEVAAEARQEAASARDERTAIHLYLLAALSAWQAGGEGEELLAAVAADGAAKCDAMRGRATRPPRDCAQLSVVPALAINDVLVSRLRRFRDLRPETTEKSDGLRDVTNRTRQNFDRLLARRTALEADRTVSPGYHEYLEHQLYILYCNHAEAATQLSLTEAGRDQGKRASEEAVTALRPKLATPYRQRTCRELAD